MEQGKKTCLCACGCNCAARTGAGCGNGYGCNCGHHIILRIVLGLFILAVVFWMGVKLGELKSSLYNHMSYGHEMMMVTHTYGNAPMIPATTGATPVAQ